MTGRRCSRSVERWRRASAQRALATAASTMLTALLACGCTAPPTATPTATSPAQRSSSGPVVSLDPSDATPAAQDAATESPDGSTTMAEPSHEGSGGGPGTGDQAPGEAKQAGDRAPGESTSDGPPQGLVIRASGRSAAAAGSPPTVRVAAPTVGPSYPREIVHRVIRTHVKQLQHCYEIQLQRNPNVGGKLVVAFDIVGSGAVQRARVQSSATGSAELDRCVVGVIASLTFPRPPGGATLHVRYPLVFAPAD